MEKTVKFKKKVLHLICLFLSFPLSMQCNISFVFILCIVNAMQYTICFYHLHCQCNAIYYFVIMNGEHVGHYLHSCAILNSSLVQNM